MGGIGEYDMEDDFIDDDEFADFVEGDLRKPKESGFFINKVGLPCTRKSVVGKRGEGSILPGHFDVALRLNRPGDAAPAKKY